MQIIRLTGLALIALCAAGMGMALALTLTERVKSLELARSVLEAFSGELSYSQAPPDEIVSRLAARETLSKAEYLPACRALGETLPFPEAWRRAVEENPGKLSAGDVGILTALSDTLGRCDLETALAALNRAMEELELALRGAREYAGTHGKLYRTLGMLSGAFLVILWI